MSRFAVCDFGDFGAPERAAGRPTRYALVTAAGDTPDSHEVVALAGAAAWRHLRCGAADALLIGLAQTASDGGTGFRLVLARALGAPLSAAPTPAEALAPLLAAPPAAAACRAAALGRDGRALADGAAAPPADALSVMRWAAGAVRAVDLTLVAECPPGAAGD